MKQNERSLNEIEILFLCLLCKCHSNFTKENNVTKRATKGMANTTKN